MVVLREGILMDPFEARSGRTSHAISTRRCDFAGSGCRIVDRSWLSSNDADIRRTRSSRVKGVGLSTWIEVRELKESSGLGATTRVEEGTYADGFAARVVVFVAALEPMELASGESSLPVPWR